MLSHYSAHDMQYRLESEQLDRELARRAAIRERREQVAADAAATLEGRRAGLTATTRATRRPAPATQTPACA